MRPRVTVTIKRDDWDKSLEVIGGSWSDLDPGDVYELVDAQVTRTTAGSTPRPDNQPCPDCGETGIMDSSCVPCPSCSVEPKQTVPNTSDEARIERAAAEVWRILHDDLGECFEFGWMNRNVTSMEEDLARRVVAAYRGADDAS